MGWVQESQARAKGGSAIPAPAAKETSVPANDKASSGGWVAQSRERAAAKNAERNARMTEAADAQQSIEEAGRQALAQSFSPQSAGMVAESLKLRDAGYMSAEEKAKQQQNTAQMQAVLQTMTKTPWEQRAQGVPVRDPLKEALDAGEEYNRYVEKGKSLENPTYYERQGAATQTWLANNIPGYVTLAGYPEGGEVKNKVTFSRDLDKWLNEEASALDKGAFKLHTPTEYHRLYSYMSDEEVNDYSYLLAKEGEKAADAYLEKLMPYLSSRELEGLGVYEQAEEHPILASVNSIGLNLLSGLGIVEDAGKVLTGQKIDPYSTANAPANIVSAARGTVSENIDSNVGKTLYGVGMSIGDNLANMAAGALVGNLFGAGTASTVLSQGSGTGALATVRETAKAGSNASLAMMGAQAATSATIQAKERGLSDNQALALGVVAGGAEILTEKFSVDALLADPKGAVSYFLQNVATEGAEEGASSVLNLLADLLIARDKSEWAVAMDAYEAQGISHKEAFLRALGEQLQSLNLDIIGGMLAGGLMAAPTTVSSGVQNARASRAQVENAARLEGGEYTPAWLARRQQAQNQQATDKTVSYPAADAPVQIEGGEQAATPTTAAGTVQEMTEDDGAIRLPAYDDGADGEVQLPAYAEAAAVTGDLQPTARMQNTEGGTSNANGRGDDQVYHGDGGRNAGVGAGGQAGGVASRAEKRAADAQRARAAIDRENRANDLRLEKVSTYDLGIVAGTTDAALTIMPQDAWDDAMQATAQRVQAQTGTRVQYVIGKMQIQTPDGVRFVNGAIVGNTMYVQANNRRYSIDQIADHEQYHAMAEADAAMVDTTAEKIRATFTAEQFAETVEKYKEAYRGVYEEGDDAIIEEILADAYAEINAFAAGATTYSETVRGVTEERRGETAERARDGESRAPPVEDDGAIRLPSYEEGLPRYSVSRRGVEDAAVDNSAQSGYAERETSNAEGGNTNGDVQGGTRGDEAVGRDAGSKPKTERGFGARRAGERGSADGRTAASVESDRLSRSAQEELRQWAVEPGIGSTASYIAQEAENRGIETIVLPDEVWISRFGEGSADVKSKDGMILMRETVEDHLQQMAVPHEETHIMLQENYAPYVEFLEEFPRRIDFSSAVTGNFFQEILNHKKYTFDEVNADPTKRQLFFDEVCATLYGQLAAGETRGVLDDGTPLDLADVLYDMDAFADEVTRLQDECARERLVKQQAREDDGAIRLPAYEGTDATTAAGDDGTIHLPSVENENTDERETRYSVSGRGLSEERRQETEQAIKDSIWGEGFDFDAASAPSGKGVIPEGMSVEEYEAASRERARAEREERMRIIPKSEFKGSAAMEKLGIRVEGTVALYDNDRAGYLLAEDRAAKSLRRELAKAEQRLGATDRQKSFANQIVAGTMTETDLHFMNEDVEKIMELADYYTAVNSLGESRLRYQKRQINSKLDEKMEELFADSDQHEPSKMPVMNYRSPQRNMLHIFGGEQGAKINREVFDPVVVNEAERYRFLNRMYDEVREFEGSDGRAKKLNKQERAAVQMVIEGRAVAEQVAGMEMRAMIESAAENMQNGMDVADAAREFQLSENEKKLAQKYAKWLQNKEILESPKVDGVRVEKAAAKYKEMFDQFYDAINDFLVVHGYEPIGFIKGYVPHLQPDAVQGKFNQVMQSLGVNEKVLSIPTSIAGQTADFKPNKRWDPHFQTRIGETTEYDVAAAYESYVEYLSDVFYHTDDIMRVRRAAAYFRRTYSPEEIRENITWAQNLRGATTDQKAAMLREAGKLGTGTAPSAADVSRMMDEYVDELYANINKTGKYSNFVMWLDNYANILAGKQSMADRGWEYGFGRKVLNAGNKVTAAFGRAQVGGNLSSALNQSSQLPMIIAECGNRNVLRAIKDMMTGEVRRAGFAESSDFLTGKKGVNGLTNTPFDSVVEYTFKPLEIMDSTISTIATRAAWHKAVSEGKTGEAAMKAADKYASQVMGSRMKGEKPLGFHSKNPIANMVNIFQVEALNYTEHLTQDVPREIREVAQRDGKKAAAKALATVVVKCLIAAFVLNRISEETYGGTPAPFDLAGLSMNFVASGEGLTTNEWLRTVIDNGWEKITGERLFDTEALDEERAFDWGAAAEDVAYNLSNDIPFVRNVSAVLGMGDNTLPLPDVWGGAKDVAESIKDSGALSWDTAESAGELLAQLIPGGRQLTKTAQGIKTMAQGGSYKGHGDDRRLQYPVDGTFGEWIAAALFGKSALNETEEFYASGATALSEKQTAVYDALIDDGADRIDTYDAIQAIRAADGARAKRAALAESDLTDRQKAQLYSGIISDSKDEEFAAMLDAGLTWQEITDAFDRYSELNEEEGKGATDKATEYAMWVDKNGWTDEQSALVKESFKFFSHVPAEAGKYEALADEGLSSDTAYSVTETLAALEPENGKSSVTSAQRYKAIVGMGLSEDQKRAALSTCMGDGVRRKMDTVCGYGVTPTQYVEYITAADADADGSGNVSQAEAEDYIDSIKGLTKKQRAALWQATNKSWSAGNNPYSKTVGAAVRETLNAEDEEDDGAIRLPE